jgi:hypothetical protein
MEGKIWFLEKTELDLCQTMNKKIGVPCSATGIPLGDIQKMELCICLIFCTLCKLLFL